MHAVVRPGRADELARVPVIVASRVKEPQPAAEDERGAGRAAVAVKLRVRRDGRGQQPPRAEVPRREMAPALRAHRLRLLRKILKKDVVFPPEPDGVVRVVQKAAGARKVKPGTPFFVPVSQNGLPRQTVCKREHGGSSLPFLQYTASVRKCKEKVKISSKKFMNYPFFPCFFEK